MKNTLKRLLPVLVIGLVSVAARAQVIETDIVDKEGFRLVHVTLKGVCPDTMDIKLLGQLIEDVKYKGGCQGYALGINKLLKGRHMDDVIEMLQGTPCGKKKTSCPDQLARVLKMLKEKCPDSVE